jgi:hypothetical protein
VQDNIWVSLIVGLALAGFGLALIRHHVVAWRRYKLDPELETPDREFFRRQFSRRVQTSGLLVLLGLMLPVGDALLVWGREPLAATFFWLGVLLITLWVMALAAGDWLLTRIHARGTNATIAQIERKKQELEAEVARLRAHRQNGHGNGHIH